jgi:Fe2+ or Zn2+ uptake regulation protein
LALTQAFRDAGLKMTPQRQLLFRLLHGHGGHPTAESLYSEASEQMPGISLRTVYQTLNDLAAMGELHVIDFAGGPARFDPNTGEHHHAECVTCGDLRDVYIDPRRLPSADSIEGLDGFRPHRTQIVFSGLCARCAECTTSHHLTQSDTITTNREYP